jgi:N-acetylglucosaminyl-diphospho-decaprenol L-rhamnosyltransferase
MRDRGSLAVQVVNYRTRRYLERCLETVVADLDGSGLEYEINLLDNASGEDLSEVAARFPRCRAFTAERNLGFGGGHNLLAIKTEASYLLILNPDVELTEPDTVKRLLLTVTGYDRVKAAGPRLLTDDGNPQPYDHGRLRGLRAAIALRGGHSYWRATDVRQEVAWVSGAVMLIDRLAFASLGGFDEQLFLYKEDEDLCLRLRRDGGRVVYNPSITICHHGGVVADRNQELAGATSYFFSKHYPRAQTRKVFATVHQWLAYLRL